MCFADRDHGFHVHVFRERQTDILAESQGMEWVAEFIDVLGVELAQAAV